VMYATHAVLPIMKEQDEGGAIVNISSAAVRTARAGLAAYDATKWGVNGFSEALRQEVNRYKIRVTIIEPGVVETGFTEHIPDPETKKEIEERIASMRPLQSKDIAAAILYAVTQPSYVDVNELGILFRPETCLEMGLANDAANLEMGPGNDAGASTDCVRQPGPQEVSTDCVRQARPKEVLRASAAHSSGRISSNEKGYHQCLTG
jgi:hypothetical protein